MLSVVLGCHLECWDIVRSAEMLFVILGMWCEKQRRSYQQKLNVLTGTVCDTGGWDVMCSTAMLLLRCTPKDGSQAGRSTDWGCRIEIGG